MNLLKKPLIPVVLVFVCSVAGCAGVLDKLFEEPVIVSEECGNNIVDSEEECDDGNLEDGDGCSALCQVELCGNGIEDDGEECDDGNNEDGDGCDAECQDEPCGNGVVDDGEACDDGNFIADDGCSSCSVDADWTCDTGEPTTCTFANCEFESAADLTGNTSITLTDTSEWEIVHQFCAIVSTGTTVTWEGDFDFHPLKGGTTPFPDATNPIEIAGPGSGMTPVDVVFSESGNYPYYCNIHTASQYGVVFVRDP